MKSYSIILILIGIVLISSCITRENPPSVSPSGTQGQIQVTEKKPVRKISENFIAENILSNNLESFKLSPDGSRVAYVNMLDDKHSVVVDGKEGKQYDIILGAGIIFDPSNNIHYLATIGTGIYAIQEN